MLPPGDSSQPPQQPPPPAQRVVDLLVDLPKDVLDKILAGLPCRDVVRTSVLSKPWRHRWESVPGLNIELHDVGRDDTCACSWISATRFLRRCAEPVGRVSIRGVPLSACRRADGWLRDVAGKKPRSLSLVQPPGAALYWPLSSLFRCDPANLTELELCRCRISAPRARSGGFAGFHRLTRLDLDDVFLTGGELEAIVSAAAPTLVELRLQNVACRTRGRVPGRWVIQGPNLRRLVLRLRIAGVGRWELGPLPNLEVARIFLNDSAEERDYVQMFMAISNVRELHIGNFRMAYQATAVNIFHDLLRRFKNLRILRHDGCFHESPANQLFRLAPSLETIEIKSWY